MRTPKNDERASGERVIPPGERPCVWMQAGLIAQWLCDLDYRCESCPLDAALRHVHGTRPELEASSPSASSPVAGSAPAAGAAGARDDAAPRDAAHAPAPEALPGSPAIHAIDAAAARRGQPFEFEELLAPPASDLDPRLLYHPGHTWVRVLGPDRVRIGLDAFAARVAGRPRSVIAPQPGTRLRRGRPCAWIDLVGGTLTVLAPLTGRVRELNSNILDTPNTLSEDPLGRGWLLDLEPLDLEADLRRLESAARFARRLRRDHTAWRRRVLREIRMRAPHLGATLQDGGARVDSLDQLLGPRRVYEIALFFLGAGRCLR